MAHAAAATVSRPLLHFLKPNFLFSSLAAPSRRHPHTSALRPVGPLPSDAEDSDDPDAGDGAAAPVKKSRNELKREARRAVQWGMGLAKFSPPQIKRILRVASMEDEVFDALMLVKSFGPDVREGRRRQFNYIGRLLRNAQPELMDTLIQSSKDGDDISSHAVCSEDKRLMEDEGVEDFPYVEEGDEEYMEIADRWFEGLLCKDISVTNEVYAVHNVEFDRQELRKLVRRVHEVQESKDNKDGGEEYNMKLSRAKKPLLRFIRSLAKKAHVNSEMNCPFSNALSPFLL